MDYKMRRIALLTSVLALSACGGDGFFGDLFEDLGFGPFDEDIVDNSFSTTTDINQVEFVILDQDKGYFCLITHNENAKTLGMWLSDYGDFDLSRKGPTSAEFEGYLPDTTRNGDTKWTTVTFKSAAKEYNIPLRYSDFGALVASYNGTGRSMVFAGEYQYAYGKRVDKDNFRGDSMDFKGVAIATLSRFSGDGRTASKDISADATLTFTPGNGSSPYQTKLTANFKDWYDIEYIQSGNDDNGRIKFSGSAGADTRFHLVNEGDTRDVSVADFMFNGDNGTPSEAVGILQVRDCANGICFDSKGNNDGFSDELRMNMAFGGTRK